ncbi:hypothetical protein OXIME_001416 [Oxyplasma meridianum]|uniref:Uncharacterized protein n=1 Tax=Oxyplasma meridianum TaxID=3073602 RepID=A0AAX4NJ32_9ARCH
MLATHLIAMTFHIMRIRRSNHYFFSYLLRSTNQINVYEKLKYEAMLRNMD